MKKLLSIICIMALVLSHGMFVSAVVDVPDVFGNEYVEYDVNIDGDFNICDLVRVKKYIIGEPVIINLNFGEKSLNNAELLVLMRKELLKGGLS